MIGLVRKTVSDKRWVVIFLAIILTFSAFFRLYRIGPLLGFWYDQGRDALVIWDFLHYGKLFLIGPTTGIEGIFLGPFYYYLLIPFYWIGRGDPSIAAAGLNLMTVVAIYLIYRLTKKIYNVETALLSAFLYGFSYNLIIFSRWLANPNPLPFFTLLTLLFLFKFIQNHNSKFLILSSFLVGLCLQIEAASAVFFLPAIIIILVWQRKNLPIRVLSLSFLAFFLTLLPQIYFNFRHEGILFNAFKKFIAEDKSFGFTLGQVLRDRVRTYYDVFFNKLVPGNKYYSLGVLALFSATMIIYGKKIINQGGKLLLIWLLVPVVGFLFYQGNHGYVWDYYFAGAIPAFVILLSAGTWNLFKQNLAGKVLFGVVLILFLAINVRFLKNYYKTGIGITLRAQKRAIDWIYKDAGGDEFNIDVYVPPKIFFSYSYLFRWYGAKTYGREPQIKLVRNLYTLYEPDGERPQFLSAWLARQDTIGKISKDYFWGDITVQKRERINKFDSSE